MSFQFTDANFAKEAIEASKDKPVLVDFFASWCGPCKMQGPIVDELASEMGDKAVIGKLDTEASPMTAEHFGIMSIPTLLIFRKGQVVEQLVGLQAKQSLKASIEKHL